jgi:hypothetical protein
MRMSTHDTGLVFEHVVCEVRVDGHLEMLLPGLGPGHELEKGAPVIAFGKALSLHDASRLEQRVWIEKAVGGDQFDTRVVWPTGEQLLEDTGDGRLPHRNRSGHAEHERAGPGRGSEEGVGDRRELMAALDVEIEQPGQWQEAVLDHVDVEVDVDTPDLLHVGLGEGQRGVGPEGGPFVTREIEIAGLAQRRQATSAFQRQNP